MAGKVNARSFVADAVAVNVTLDPYLSLRGLASYSSLSVRTLRGYLSDPLRPLPCYRIGGKIVVRISEFDTWLSAHRETLPRVDVRAIVDDMLGPKKVR